MPRHLKVSEKRPFRLLVGVGGIGSGLFFALEGDRTLGRNESRPAEQLDIRDYCKLHIIAHYVSVLLGARPSGNPFHVLPVGKVGDDSQGRSLLEEMKSAGMDTRFVDVVAGKPTLLSVCFQYPDGSGGNVTTSNSAASLVSIFDVDRLVPYLQEAGPLAIVLAAPEVPLEIRARLLSEASRTGAFRVASFTSVEMEEVRESGLLSMVDFLSINEDEGAALAGVPFDLPEDSPQGEEFFERLAGIARARNPEMLLVMSAGQHGAFAYDGTWTHVPACRVKVAATGGAGDALLAGTLSALTAGLPLPEATRFGVILAGLSVTSPHTIHPGVDVDALLDFAAERELRIPGCVLSRLSAV